MLIFSKFLIFVANEIVLYLLVFNYSKQLIFNSLLYKISFLWFFFKNCKCNFSIFNIIFYWIPFFFFSYLFRSNKCLLALNYSKCLVINNLNELISFFFKLTSYLNFFFTAKFYYDYFLNLYLIIIKKKNYFYNIIFFFYYNYTIKIILLIGFGMLSQLLFCLCLILFFSFLFLFYLCMFYISILIFKILTVKIIPIIVFNFLNIKISDLINYISVFFKIISIILNTFHFIFFVFIRLPIFNWIWAIYYQIFTPRRIFNYWLDENKFLERYKLFSDEDLDNFEEIFIAMGDECRGYFFFLIYNTLYYIF